MAIWTMPKIVVEGFAANEYVAACAEMAGVSLPDNAFYVDLSQDDFHPVANNSEDINDNNGTSITLKQSGTYSNARLNNINFYKDHNHVIIAQSYTLLIDHRVDTYDVYILGDGITGLLYPTGTYDGNKIPFTPTATKNFTS